MSLIGSGVTFPLGNGAPGVGYVREELRWFMREYETIRDCIGGARVIKTKARRYLPQPDSFDPSPENTQRYKDYIERAVFYNATRRTLGGMVGEVFGRDPIIEINDQLDFLKADATGTGVPLIQLSKRILSRTLAFGRAGIFVDFPQTDGVVSKADLENGMRPSLTAFNSWEIPNWRTDVRGTEEVYTLIVLMEPYIAADDGFEIKTGMQYRVLRLVNSAGELDPEGEYSVELWRKPGKIGGPGAPTIYQQEYFPIINGERANKIPFNFVGSETNDSAVDHPPLYDLADMNIAHYRNSADYEEACFMHGQPTPWVAGLTKQWVDTVFKDGKIRFGSRSVVPLPVQGEAGLLQMEPNTGAKEAMEHKERLMIALGAEIVQTKTVQRTATEANQEKASRSSVLSTTADNTSDAMTKAIQIAGEYMGVDISTTETDTKFKLNTEFDLNNMTPQQIQAVVAAWQANAISRTEMRENFRRGGIATQDDKEAEEEITNEMADSMGREVEHATRLAEAAAAANPPAGE